VVIAVTDELDRLMDKVLGPETAELCRQTFPWIGPPFMPDMALVEALATYLSEIPKGCSDMAIAFAILRKLHDLGIELPTVLIDGGGDRSPPLEGGDWGLAEDLDDGRMGEPSGESDGAE
jgi:hypothetical protein